MKLSVGEHVLEVEREKGDKWIGESTLLHAIKKEMNTRGYSFITKRMWKDGHLVDDEQQYIRARKLPVKKGEIESIYDTHWCIRRTCDPYNAFATLRLAINRV